MGVLLVHGPSVMTRSTLIHLLVVSRRLEICPAEQPDGAARAVLMLFIVSVCYHIPEHPPVIGMTCEHTYRYLSVRQFWSSTAYNTTLE